jgi:hypothetical protein
MKLEVLNLSNNPLSSQFEPLLEVKNQTNPNLRNILGICFNIVQDSTPKPNWFDQPMN